MTILSFLVLTNSLLAAFIQLHKFPVTFEWNRNWNL